MVQKHQSCEVFATECGCILPGCSLHLCAPSCASRVCPFHAAKHAALQVGGGPRVQIQASEWTTQKSGLMRQHSLCEIPIHSKFC